MTFNKGPKLGTPQNPEIIEPGESPKAPPQMNRWKVIFSLVRALISVCIPALILDFACAWLWQFSSGPSGFFAGVALFFLAVPAFLLTLVAIAATAFFLLMIVLALSGKPVTWSFQTMGIPRNFGGGATRIRDVTETSHTKQV